MTTGKTERNFAEYARSGAQQPSTYFYHTIPYHTIPDGLPGVPTPPPPVYGGGGGGGGGHGTCPTCAPTTSQFEQLHDFIYLWNIYGTVYPGPGYLA